MHHSHPSRNLASARDATRPRRLVRALAAAALAGSLGLASPVSALSGVPTACMTLPWYDFYSWWYGYAGICFFNDGPSMWYDANGNYGYF